MRKTMTGIIKNFTKQAEEVVKEQRKIIKEKDIEINKLEGKKMDTENLKVEANKEL